MAETGRETVPGLGVIVKVTALRKDVSLTFSDSLLMNGVAPAAWPVIVIVVWLARVARAALGNSTAARKVIAKIVVLVMAGFVAAKQGLSDPRGGARVIEPRGGVKTFTAGNRKTRAVQQHWLAV